MTRAYLILLFCFCFSLNGYAQQKKQHTPLIPHVADIGIIYPITSSGAHAPAYNNTISLQALAGVTGGIRGCALAGIVNSIKEDAHGAIFAGIGNTVGRKAKGALFAGLFNLTGDLEGSQTAGLFNKAEKVNGIQIAGLYNQSTDVDGVQLSGLINRAKKVKGVQIAGLINLADSSDYPIGFINLIKKGDKNITLSTDESLNMLLGFQSGGRVLYGRLGLGYKLNSDYDLFLLEAAIGAHLLNTKGAFRLNAEAAQLLQTDFTNGHLYSYSLRMLSEIKLTNRLSLLAGPSAYLVLDYSRQEFSGNTGHYFWTTTSNKQNSHFIGAYIGFTGRLQFTL